MQFHERVLLLRRQHQWTQNQLAHRSCMSETQVRNIEQGRVQPTLRTIILLADAYGMSLTEFFQDVHSKE